MADDRHAPSPTWTLEHDGCALAYRLRGDGPPVVFIQGVGLHGDGWDPQVDALREHYRCLTFDNRGMGASQPLSGVLDVERMAQDVLALMDAQGWASAHVVGHSLGGLVAQHLGLVARARVRSLALLCTVARGSHATRITWPVVKVGVLAAVGTRRMRRRAFLDIVMPRESLRSLDRDALAASLVPIFGHDLAEQPPVVDHQLKALRAYDATRRLAELAAIPTLVVSARHDPIAPPRFGQALARGIAGARYVEIADAAHGVTVQRSERVNTVLLEHLAGVEERHAVAAPTR
jgi:pimeloyl-ACP methyl ester carboxylesterase